MKVYHFINAEFGLKNIQRRRLKIARIGELNDPYEFMARANNALERAALQHVKVQQSQKTGLLCFSRNWKNPVQWSHYADRHRGVCLGFDVPDTQIKEVTYRKSPLRFDLKRFRSDENYAQNFSDSLVSTKFEDWQYEEEWRLYIRLEPMTEDEEGRYFFDFSEELKLAEVIVGAASAITRSQLADALGARATEVQCRKARLAFNSFRIVKQGKGSLWS